MFRALAHKRRRDQVSVLRTRGIHWRAPPFRWRLIPSGHSGWWLLRLLGCLGRRLWQRLCGWFRWFWRGIPKAPKGTRTSHSIARTGRETRRILALCPDRSGHRLLALIVLRKSVQRGSSPRRCRIEAARRRSIVARRSSNGGSCPGEPRGRLGRRRCRGSRRRC